MKLLHKTVLLFSLPILASCASGEKAAESKTTTPEVVTEEVTYKSGDTELKGYVAYPKGAKDLPAVLVVHEWWGQTEYPRNRAEMLAKEGYVAMAVDMYGDRAIADHPKKAGEFAKKAMSDMKTATARFKAAMDYVQKLPQTNPEKVAAVGYCFGGTIVMEMARRGLDLDAVASFHGGVPQGKVSGDPKVKADLLILNGAADPMVKKQDLESFAKNLEKSGAEVKVVNYEGAKHAFTNPDATEKGKKFNLPLAYDKEADEKSWQELESFLKKAL